IAVRPLKGDSFEVEVGEEAKVAALKQSISSKQSEMPVEQQKLIYQGRILTDEMVVKDLDIKSGEFVVVMVAKAKAPAGAPAAAPAAVPAAAPASAAPAGGGPNEYEAAASTLVGDSAMEGTITQLMEMGFEREQVVRCLQAAFNNPDRAVDYLMSGIPAGAMAAEAPDAEM
ncbi:unnamed protein product, partial [Polarella glacialis]